MSNLTTTTLRRALELQIKIESMQRELAEILGTDLAIGLAAPAAGAAKASVRRGRKPGRPAKEVTEKPAKRVSPLKGKKRSASPSGPLAPAVLKVMERSGGPLNVDAVLQGLAQDNYIWNVADPKKNLAARIYKLAGLKQVGPGLFDLASRVQPQ